jgi:membrane-associated phospholipid phosphatase
MPDAGSAADCPHTCYRRRIYWVVAWLALIVLAALMDRWVASLGLRLADVVDGHVKDTLIAKVLKAPGDFRFTLVVAVVAIWLHPWKWRAGGLVCLSAMIGGLLYVVLKWGVGRRRPKMNLPFDLSPFIGGWRGLLVSESNLSFPSGHATCAFATAAALAVLYPRWRWAFYAAAALTALERVAERAHYLSDVVAAAGVGVLSVQVSILLANLLINREGPLETPAVSCQAPPRHP